MRSLVTITSQFEVEGSDTQALADHLGQTVEQGIRRAAENGVLTPDCESDVELVSMASSIEPPESA